jgi:hypothetical protein
MGTKPCGSCIQNCDDCPTRSRPRILMSWWGDKDFSSAASRDLTQMPGWSDDLITGQPNAGLVWRIRYNGNSIKSLVTRLADGNLGPNLQPGGVSNFHGYGFSPSANGAAVRLGTGMAAMDTGAVRDGKMVVKPGTHINGIMYSYVSGHDGFNVNESVGGEYLQSTLPGVYPSGTIPTPNVWMGLHWNSQRFLGEAAYDLVTAWFHPQTNAPNTVYTTIGAIPWSLEVGCVDCRTNIIRWPSRRVYYYSQNPGYVSTGDSPEPWLMVESGRILHRVMMTECRQMNMSEVRSLYWYGDGSYSVDTAGNYDFTRRAGSIPAPSLEPNCPPPPGFEWRNICTYSEPALANDPYLNCSLQTGFWT